MPRKGWKKPAAIAATHCPKCGKPLPIAALGAWQLLLANIRASLGSEPPAGSNSDDLRRFRTLQVVHARASLGMLADEQDHVCTGHDPVKRGPRKKEPPPLDITKPERKRGPRALAAVPDE